MNQEEPKANHDQFNRHFKIYSMSLFSKRNQLQASESILDQALYTIPGTRTPVTWADTLEGTLILGATGSGKSSGPARHAAMAMLKSGFGFVVLCAKNDEARRWLTYTGEAGREDDVILFNEESKLEFNILEYERRRPGKGSGEISNMVERLMSLNEQSKIHLSGGDGKEEPFWNNALRRIIGKTLGLLLCSNRDISMRNMHQVVTQAFDKEEVELFRTIKNTILSTDEIDPERRKQAESDLIQWEASSSFVQMINLVSAKTFDSDEEQEDAENVLDYWLRDFPKLAEDTRSSIVESFKGVIEPFIQRGLLKNQFSKGMSPELFPENIIQNKKILIVDFALKDYVIPAVFAATLVKTAFQSAAERRKVEEEGNPKPVCLWIDEYQAFCSPITDALFQTTARSSWVATTFLTQNLHNLFFVMGNNQPQARAKSLLGNMNLKYFCSNSCDVTNVWASDMIGEEMADYETLSISKDQELSKTKNQRLTKRIRPDQFTTLKTGRVDNRYKVEAVVFKAGKTWGKEKANFARASFDQRS